MREIEFYETSTGHCPVKDFLLDLPFATRKKVLVELDALAKAHRPDDRVFKKLSGGKGLWELRVRHKGLAIRILGFQAAQGRLVFCHGFFKKDQQIPLEEISVAEKRRVDYAGRNP